MLLIPVIAAVQFLFTMGLGILLSSLNAFFRDIQNVLRHVLRLWFYLSPALYSLSIVADGHPTIHALLRAQPVRRAVRLVSSGHLGLRTDAPASTCRPVRRTGSVSSS